MARAWDSDSSSYDFASDSDDDGTGWLHSADDNMSISFSSVGSGMGTAAGLCSWRGWCETPLLLLRPSLSAAGRVRSLAIRLVLDHAPSGAQVRESGYRVCDAIDQLKAPGSADP